MERQMELFCAGRILEDTHHVSNVEMQRQKSLVFIFVSYFCTVKIFAYYICCRMYRWSVNERRKFLDCGFASILDGSVLKCSSRPSIFHLPSHGSRCSAGFPDTGAEKGASSGRNRERNTRQPTSLPAVVSDTRPDLHLPPSRGPAEGIEEGGRVEGWRGEGGVWRTKVRRRALTGPCITTPLPAPLAISPCSTTA